MDTFELLPSLAQGDLAHTSAPELVTAVFRARASGTLYFEVAGTEVRVFFRAGEMAGTGVFSGFQTLAQVLLANDWVDALTIDATRSEAAETRRRHGEILVERGVFTPERLREALALQHASNLARVLAFRSGHYVWRGTEPPPAWAREVLVDPVVPMLRALAQPTHAAARERILAWLGDVPASFGPDWTELERRIAAAAPALLAAAAPLAHPATAGEFAAGSGLSREESDGLFAGLLLCGALAPAAAGEPVEPVDEEELELMPADEEPLELATETAAASAPGSSPIAQGRDDAALDEPGSLELDERDHAGRQPQPHGSAPPEPAPPLAADAPRGDEAANERRRRMRLRGMRNLGVLPQAAPERPEEPASDAPALDSAGLSAADRAFVEEVRARLRTLDSQDVYARLGVRRDLAQEGLKAAYLNAVRRFHPDRAVGALLGLQPELHRLFSGLRDAWERVATPELRAQYEAEESGGGAAGSGMRDDARMALQMGEVLLKRRDFDGALQKLRRASELEPNGDTLAALAWCMLSHPKHPQKEEALALVERGLRLSGVTARTHYVLGVLLRTKDPERAMASFRKAIELDPAHSDAALELRLLEQRRAPKVPGKSGGLGGLFKRKP